MKPRQVVFLKKIGIVILGGKLDIKTMTDGSKKRLEALFLAGEKEIPRIRSVKIPPAQKPSKTPSAGDPSSLLNHLRKEIGECTRCRLCEGRTHLVFGVGNPKARLMFVGEAPGRDEDRKGEPFVGRAGQLLDKIIEAMKFKREEVFIANVIKCRPPENRNPAPDEIETCEPFLLRQIEIIQPKVIVCLGTFATQTLLDTEAKISSLRSRFHAWPSATLKARFETTLPEGSIQLMPTFHPAFLLRNPQMKRAVWEDMQHVMKILKK